MHLWLRGIALAFVAAHSWTAYAGDAWRVVDTAGTVRIGGAGFQPVALTRDQDLPKDAWVETAENGRVVLVRGLETIVVEPSSRVQLPAASVNGNTQVLQFLGSAIYKIGKQAKPHFQVDTPYLAAVVKGTSFTVTVNDGAAAVEVTEGLVEVATPDQSDTEFVRPGFTAVVSREHSNDVVVDHTPKKDEPAAPDQPAEKSVKSDAAASPVVSIAEPIGEVEVNVKEVSGGLVSTDVHVVDVVDVKTDGTTKEPGAASDSAGGNGGGADHVSLDVKESPAEPVGQPVADDSIGSPGGKPADTPQPPDVEVGGGAPVGVPGGNLGHGPPESIGKPDEVDQVLRKPSQS